MATCTWLLARRADHTHHVTMCYMAIATVAREQEEEVCDCSGKKR